MSQLIARQVMSRLNMAGSLIAPLGDIAGDLMQLASADREKEIAKVDESRTELCEAYGFNGSDERKPFAFAAGLAIIPVHGSLINRFGQSYGFVTGYNFIRSQLAMALADDDVIGIVLDCNSYGGEAAGCFETSDEIYAARGQKPMIAVIDSNSYSACYAIASAADKVVITPTGGSGSVGVVAMHVSMEKMLEDFGIKVTLIYSGDHKIDGNPFEDLPEPVRADIQRGVDASRAKFVSLVARNRGLDEAAVKDTEAAIYRAEESMAIGFVDEVATPQVAVTAFLGELTGSTENLEKTVGQEAQAKPGAEATQQTMSAEDKQALATSERERCSGILNCEEGKANPKLANHLAFNTAMSVEDAKAMLTAAGPAVSVEAAAPAEPAKPAAEKPNAFQEAMDGSRQPEVDADGKITAEQQAGGDAVKRILGSYQAAAGKALA